ncbi:hypothetical protein [Roseisolibacter sp. H3M3-2]|uniref:hypothetical protein n=1 Tax=Roseisolibacter sp. H3M3-2 TaxID=3031323 RepID=UPI0023DB568B|nr:hypothetical protein [Roseisolibacter sp. H3M3-2]MDF1503908.1 hypothetical protein [Roseisolibacter sp. H3M3-2]
MFPSSAATQRTAVTTFFRASRSLAAGPRSARKVASRSVPPQVRKSFALYGTPAASCR